MDNQDNYSQSSSKTPPHPKGYLAVFSPGNRSNSAPTALSLSLDAQKNRFKTLASAIKMIGGIPMMVKWSDLSELGSVDERAVICYVGYLSGRALTMKREVNAAILIQRTIRHYCNRLRENIRLKAVLCIQYHVKKWLKSQAEVIQARKRLQLEIHSAIIIQKWMRSIRKMRYDRDTYKEMKQSTIVVQRIYRGYAVRKMIMNWNHQAMIIQKMYRGWKTWVSIRKLTLATIIIQKRWRARQEGKKIRQMVSSYRYAAHVIERSRQSLLLYRQFKVLKEKTMICQSLVRRNQIRKWFIGLKIASQMIQKYWMAKRKGLLQRQWYLNYKSKVIQGQSFIRRYLAERNFNNEKKKVILIQSHIKRFVYQKRYQLYRQSIILIQNNWRRYITQKNYQQLRTICIQLQHRRRALIQGRKDRLNYISTQQSVLVLQKVWRQHQVRQRYLKDRKNIIQVQSIWRQKLYSKRYIKLKEASHVIAVKWKAILEGRQIYRNYLRMKHSTIIVQRQWRHILEIRWKTRIAASIKLQSWIRSILAQRELQQLRKRYQAVIKLQSTWKAVSQSQQYQMDRFKIKQLQIRWKAIVQGRQTFMSYQLLRLAVIQIQKRYRSALLCRQIHSEYLALRSSVIKLQSLVRRNIMETRYKEMKTSAIRIQIQWKANLMKKEQRQEYLKLKETVNYLQSKRRALIIGRQQRLSYLHIHQSVLLIQRNWRSYQSRVKENASITIQSIWKMWKLRRPYLLIKKTATQLASIYHMRKSQNHYQLMKRSAIHIQRVWKGYQCRQQIAHHLAQRSRVMMWWKYNMAAYMIQKTYKKHLAFVFATRRLGALIKIQSMFRRVLAQRQFQQSLHSIRLIQKMYRRHLFILGRKVSKIQALYRGYSVRKELKKTQEAIHLIQRVWRGYQVRKKSTPKEIRIRKRVMAANANVEEHMKLCNRTTHALELLSESKQLTTVIKALHHLGKKFKFSFFHFSLIVTRMYSY